MALFGDDNLEERTEEPTQQRRDEWRQEGKVLQSREVVAALLLLSAAGALYGASSWSLRALFNLFQNSFYESVRLGNGDFTIQGMVDIATDLFKLIALIAGPVVGATFVTGVFSSLMQTGVVFSTKVIQMDPEKLNPLNGISRIFSMDGVSEMIKAVLKFVIIGSVVYIVLRQRVAEVSDLWQVEAQSMSLYLGRQIVTGLFTIGISMLVLAGIDYGYQRFRFEQKLKMTKQELREERRQQDGNPQMKARVRAIQRKVSQVRMMEAVKTADVVITNPTHIAVALIYDRENMLAPKVVAKGADFVAERIKKIARENGIPCVENVPLARALYKALKIGQFISRDLFNAVAEVLAYVYRLKGKTEL